MQRRRFLTNTAALGVLAGSRSSGLAAGPVRPLTPPAKGKIPVAFVKGKAATTHHQFLDRFAQEFPDVPVRRGVRFVEHDGVATAGGLSSGIDLALRVVERYFGRETARRTATYMEYQSTGWIV